MAFRLTVAVSLFAGLLWGCGDDETKTAAGVQTSTDADFGSPTVDAASGGLGDDQGRETGGAGAGTGTGGGDGAIDGLGQDLGAGCFPGVVAVAAGSQHTCARLGDNTLWCWGWNVDGQLGDGTVNDRPSLGKPLPVQVTALGTRVVEVAAGNLHTCARTVDNTLWCWGKNSSGQLGIETQDGASVDLSADPLQVVALGTSVAQVTTGYEHTCARMTDGTLWCWGGNSLGQIGNGTSGRGISTPQQVSTSVAEVVAGMYYTCARKTDGTLWCWGDNRSGEIGEITLDPYWKEPCSNCRTSPVQITALGTSVVQTAAGWGHVCARKADGTLWCWGDNSSGALGDGTVNRDSNPRPAQVAALGADVAQVAAGNGTTCARKLDGSLWCWGSGVAGQLGIGTQDTTPSPIRVADLGDAVIDIVLGGSHACARMTDGRPWCWGKNEFGQVGDGTTGMSRLTPVQLRLGCL